MEERHVRVVLDDAVNTHLNFECSSDGHPEECAVEHDSEHAFSVEWLERLAAASRRIRLRAGDARSVCPDHGFYVSVSEGASVASVASVAQHWTEDGGDELVVPSCPKCLEKVNAGKTVAILRNVEKVL